MGFYGTQRGASLPPTIQPYRASRTLQPQNDADLFMRNEKWWCICFSPASAYDLISGVMVMWTLWSKDYSVCPAGCGLWPSHTNASLCNHLQRRLGEAYLLTGRKQTIFVLLKRKVWSQVSDVLLKWQEQEWSKTAMTSHSRSFVERGLWVGLPASAEKNNFFSICYATYTICKPFIAYSIFYKF